MTNDRALLVPLVLQSTSLSAATAAALSLLTGYALPTQALAPAPTGEPADQILTALAARLRAVGLPVNSVMVPADTLGLLAVQGPLVVVARRCQNEPTGLLVLWRRFGPLTQVLDTRAGRGWLVADRLQAAAEEERCLLCAEEWRSQAAALAWLFQQRLARLTHDEALAESLVQQALNTPGWRPLATLDAALRFVGRLAAAGAVERGREALVLINQLYGETLAGPLDRPGPIPAEHWTVCADSGHPERLHCRGVMTLVCHGPAAPEPELVAKPGKRPAWNSLAVYWHDQRGLLALLGFGLGVAAAGVVAQALILRGLLAFGGFLPTTHERALGLALLLGMVLSLLLLEGSIAALLGRLGRRLDARLRIALMTLLPRLGGPVFQRLGTADLMERIHTVRDLHNLPELVAQIVRIFFQLLLTLLGLALISPLAASLGLVNVIVVLGLVLIGAQVALAQQRRLRAAVGDLSRHTLDGMLGNVAVHAHRAGPALRNAHEHLLARWARHARALARTECATAALGTAVSTLLVALMVVLYSLDGAAVHLPLLLFWSLQLGALSEQLARLGFVLVGEQSKAERFLELTDLPVEHPTPEPVTHSSPPEGGVAVVFDQVDVEHAGQMILSGLGLSIAPGSQVAIVGPSGAGKSTLVGLLLGHVRPAKGTLLIDGQILTDTTLKTLRAQTAWVDPAVQIWNQSFLRNITYGSDLAAPRGAVDVAVGELIEQLPNGMQSSLGERGRLVSGGQGQRVRYARAIQRHAARLVILDEPFRGLDRTQRQALLEHARLCWPGATLLCVTHDTAQTTDFERVIVLDGGRLVEDGCPTELAAQATSRYAALLAADQAVDAQFWAGQAVPWRRITLNAGQLEASAPQHQDQPIPLSPQPARPALAQPTAEQLTWPEAQLPDLFAQLAKSAFAGEHLPEPRLPVCAPAHAPAEQQITHLAGLLGLEADSFVVQADRIDALLASCGPALLRLPCGGWLALCAGGRVWVRLIGPDGRQRRVSVARLRRLLREAQEQQASQEVTQMLASLVLEPQQRHRAARALLHDRLAGVQVAQGWSLRLAAAGPLWPQLRRGALPHLLMLAAMCEGLLSLLYAMGILGAGLLAAQPQLAQPVLLGLVLALLGRAPLEWLKQRCQLTISLRLRTLLKRRLHAGVIRLAPADLQQYGIGQFLSWQMEAERLESVGTAAPLLISTSIALLVCTALLAGGLAGGLLAPLLLGWLSLTGLLGWRAYRAYLAQRSCHIQTSRDTLERLDGHQTRLAQEHPAQWHADEDAALERYLALAKRDDAYRGLLATLLPYGWLLLALVALAPTLLAWPSRALELGVSLLGIAWAFQLLRALAPMMLEIQRVLGAWQLLAPIERAARQPSAVVDSPPEPQPAPERPLLELRNLCFGYLGQRQPLLSHCDLTIHYGERLLLTGPSGGGKSTLAALLARLRPAQSGLLMLSGLDQHTLSADSWRRQVVMVAQFHENHLFSASLAFNLLMGRHWPPTAADLHEAEQICCELGLGDLLHRMPAGLAQLVGEGGWQLSHGERSRLFVARALLQPAHVLILDESLAAVDAANLRATMSCVLARAPTLILIAHP